MQSFWNDLPRPFFVLAPMEQVTDVVFRHVVQKAGAPDVFYTEFANATGWVHAGSKGIGGRLVKTDDEHPIVAQIWGGEPGDLEQFANYCAQLGYDGIDINMGCPAKSAVKSGGAALIRQPGLAAQAIAAAKKAGLPVSAKTRLGYSRVDEWREWLAHLLQQDIVTLTIHLRSKKEMSKVPAHWELIPEIKKLRDEIAPHTLLVINGDIKDRAEGKKLAAQYGVDGIMIGRGIFTNPFCFADVAATDTAASRPLLSPPALKPGLAEVPEVSLASVSRKSAKATDERRLALPFTPERVTTGGAAPTFEEIPDFSKEGADQAAGPADSDLRAAVKNSGNDGSGEQSSQKQKLIGLLHYHLDLYDQYAAQTKRPYETLKRFFKIYIRDFDGASDLREQLMHTTSTDQARELLKTIG